MVDVPFHEQREVYGVSEDCKYNDHSMCHNPRCGCDCHSRIIRADPGNRGRTNTVAATSDKGGLDKYCPQCKIKCPSDQNFCKVDGTKLSSLRCPECNNPGDETDNYCGYCGCSMKASDRQLEEAATGSRITEESPQSPEEAEAMMKAAMAEVRLTPSNMAPKLSKVSTRMFK